MGRLGSSFALNARRRFGASGVAGPDFTLSSNSVTTEFGLVNAATLTPVDASGPVYFVIVEDTNTSADYAGFAVSNG